MYILFLSVLYFDLKYIDSLYAMSDSIDNELIVPGFKFRQQSSQFGDSVDMQIVAPTGLMDYFSEDK